MPYPIARSLAALLGLVLLAACSADPDAQGPCGLTLRGQVPVHVRNGRPMVDVAIGGGAGTFLLDTGAAVTSLRTDIVDRLKLPTGHGRAVTINGASGSAIAPVATLADISIAGVPLGNATAPVLSRADSAALMGVDGALGMDLLRRYDIDMDLPNSRMGLYAGRACPGDALPVPGPLNEVFTPPSQVSMANLRDPRLYARVMLDGRELVGMLDTGAQLSNMFWDAASRVGLDDATLASDRSIAINGIGSGTVRAVLHRFGDFRIGGQVVFPPILLVMPRGYPADVHLIVGMDFLGRNRVWMSRRASSVLVSAGLAK